MYFLVIVVEVGYFREISFLVPMTCAMCKTGIKITKSIKLNNIKMSIAVVFILF